MIRYVCEEFKFFTMNFIFHVMYTGKQQIYNKYLIRNVYILYKNIAMRTVISPSSVLQTGNIFAFLYSELDFSRNISLQNFLTNFIARKLERKNNNFKFTRLKSK